MKCLRRIICRSCDDNDGFTMVEAITAWLIFLILLAGTVKGFQLGTHLSAEGRRYETLASQAYEYAVRGRIPSQDQEELLFFQMGDKDGTVRVHIREYRGAEDPVGKDEKPMAPLKQMVLD